MQKNCSPDKGSIEDGSLDESDTGCEEEVYSEKEDVERIPKAKAVAAPWHLWSGSKQHLKRENSR
eukprot:11237458-Prorocentrum_lima.AAC.1